MGYLVATNGGASTGSQVGSLVADFTPFVGTGKSAVEVFTGKDLITGEETSRLAAGAGIFLGLIPGGKLLLKGGKIAKIAGKVGSHADEVGDAANSVKFFRGSKPGEAVNFIPRVGSDVKVDKVTGFINPDKGVSVFNNAESVLSKGFTPHEIDMKTVPDFLQIIQKRSDPAHFEILPKSGVNLTLKEYTDAVCTIMCK